MKVLVTGASGFIGRHALPRLVALGYDVHAVSKGEGFPSEGVTWHRADLLDAASCRSMMEAVRPTHFLHLAWYAVPGRYWTSPVNLQWVSSTLTLFASFAEHGGQRFVAAGTCAEYDWNYGSCSEGSTPLKPTTLYGAAKKATGELIIAAAKQVGVSCAWGRIFYLYGPYEHPDRLVSSVIRSLLRRQPIDCTSGEQRRDFLHVDDVASAFVSLIASDTVEGAINIASGQPVEVRSIIKMIAGLTDGCELAHLGARPMPAGDPPLIVADVCRLHNELGWEPFYDLKAGLAQTIEWWQRAIEEAKSG